MEWHRRNWLEFVPEPQEKTPATIRSAPQAGKTKLTRRIDCKRDGRRLERLVRFDRGNTLANVGGIPVSPRRTPA